MTRKKAFTQNQDDLATLIHEYLTRDGASHFSLIWNNLNIVANLVQLYCSQFLIMKIPNFKE